MYQDKVILCVSNAYLKKYYLNEDFNGLPETIRNELKIMCVLFTEEVGGVLSLVYDEDGTLLLEIDHNDDDFFFDEIGSVLKVKEIQREKCELLESLELYYKVFFLGEDM